MPNEDELLATNSSTNDQYLVVSNLYGKITEDPLNFNVINENYKGSNSSKVLLDNQVEAFIELGEPSSDFDYKIVASEIADLFDIKVTPIHRLKKNNQFVGIIRRSNAELDQVALTLDKIKEKLQLKIEGNELEGKPWLEALNRITKNEGPITDEADFKTILDMPLYLVVRSFVKMHQTEYARIKKDYINALFFDYVINQAKRSLSEYSVLINNTTGKHTFGALYSFNSQENEGLNPDEYILNTNIVKRDDLIKYLYKYYYFEIEELSKMICENLPDYQKCLELILKHNYTQGDYLPLYQAILSNLEQISQYEAQYSDKNKNNIELTQTNIMLQLKAKKNINNVLARYPLNTSVSQEKEEPLETIEEGIKLTLEPDNKKNSQRSGFVNGTLIVLLIILVFAIGIGIGYLIFNISGV